MDPGVAFGVFNLQSSGYSWYHWLTEAETKIDPLIALAGILLLIG